MAEIDKSKWWYREIRPRPWLSVHIFRAGFAWRPTIGEWTCKRGVSGHTLDWLWWSIGYYVD